MMIWCLRKCVSDIMQNILISMPCVCKLLADLGAEVDNTKKFSKSIFKLKRKKERN